MNTTSAVKPAFFFSLLLTFMGVASVVPLMFAFTSSSVCLFQEGVWVTMCAAGTACCVCVCVLCMFLYICVGTRD